MIIGTREPLIFMSGGVEKNLEHDEESVDGEKNHPCDEMVGLETTGSDGLKGNEDDRTVPSLLVNGSGDAWMVDEHADDVAEGFGVLQTVNHFVDVFCSHPCLRPRWCPPAHRHRLGHLLDARLTDQTAERVYPRLLDLRTRMCLCYAAVLGGYQQSQQRINVGGE